MTTRYAFFEGRIVPIDQAKVSIMTHAFNYGTGCFEGIRAYWNKTKKQLYVFKLEEHYERFLHSCHIIRISLPYSVEELCGITVELLREEGFRQDTYVRPLAYKADAGIGVRLHDLEDQFALFATPFGKYIEREEGAKVGVSSWRRINDNAVPARAKITGAYINSALIKTDAVMNGFDEAIVLTQQGHVSEGSAENLFIARQGKLITSPVTEDILEGITRATLIELAAKELGIETVERPIDRTELYVADEAFFCGTGVQIAAISEIDHRPVGRGTIGPIVTQLRDLYFSIARGEKEDYLDWITPVYAAVHAM
ncbi:MAG: branched chain amino acid aminotransferase [Chloroflexi bacterium B3_Chlor]|nr:MAG: branched chain amino acid aminotransferase [Chloroflexi bacterium B3_Chlor]